MPKKGRSQPCDDVLRIGHSKQRQYTDVRSLSEKVLDEYRDKLPEYDWKEGTRLCFYCRTQAATKAGKREKALHAVQALTGRNQEQASTESGDNQLYPNLPGSNNDGQELSNTTESRSALYSPSAPTPENIGEAESPSAPTQEDVFITPTKPSSSKRDPPQPTPTTSTFSPAPSQTTFPSVTGTPSSVTSGSVFHDEETAKFELNEFLKKLGVQPPDKHAKARPRRLFKIMTEAMTAFRNKFKEYAGGTLPEGKCTCQFSELITAAAKAKVPETESKKEKYIMLTSLPPFVTINQMHDEIGVSWYMARTASKLRSSEGPFSFPEWKSTGRPLSDAVKEIVKEFYLSDDNSKADPTALLSINVVEHGKRDRKERRLMYTNLKDSFQEFKKVHPDIKIGISKFAELRPKNVKWPGQTGVQYSCLCTYHENFKLLLEGLKQSSMEAMEEEFSTDPSVAAFMQRFDDYKEFVSYVLCDPPSEDCYLGYCSLCPINVNYERILSFSDENDIRYKYWEKNDIVTRIDDHSIFTERFPDILAKFILHDFIYRQQKDFIKMLKNGPLENGTSAVLTVDFGENYSFVVQNAIQGFHWNNSQATIHPFVIYTSGETPGRPEYKTYFVISDDMGHDANAFHCFRIQVIRRIKEDFPRVKHIDYVSDGATSQYKNGYNIANLLYHQDDFNLTARWHFTCTSHGKSTCDGMSAVVKRNIRLKSLSKAYKDDPINTSLRMFQVAQAELTSERLEFLFVTREDVNYYRESLKTRYARMKKIKGTRKWHYLAVGRNKELITKQFGFSNKEQTFDLVVTDEAEVMEVDPAPFELNIGDFYAIAIGRTYQIGVAMEIFYEKETVNLKMMKKAGQAGVSLSWPPAEKMEEVDGSDIIVRVSPPVFNEQKQTYRLTDADLTKIQSIFKKK